MAPPKNITLIEVLTIIVVIGLLLGMLIPVIHGMKQKAAEYKEKEMKQRQCQNCGACQKEENKGFK